MNVSIFAAITLLFCSLLGKATANKGIVHLHLVYVGSTIRPAHILKQLQGAK